VKEKCKNVPNEVQFQINTTKFNKQDMTKWRLTHYIKIIPAYAYWERNFKKSRKKMTVLTCNSQQALQTVTNLTET
jgi:hypothetical protein